MGPIERFDGVRYEYDHEASAFHITAKVTSKNAATIGGLVEIMGAILDLPTPRQKDALRIMADIAEAQRLEDIAAGPLPREE